MQTMIAISPLDFQILLMDNHRKIATLLHKLSVLFIPVHSMNPIKNRKINFHNMFHSGSKVVPYSRISLIRKKTSKFPSCHALLNAHSEFKHTFSLSFPLKQ